MVDMLFIVAIFLCSALLSAFSLPVLIRKMAAAGMFFFIIYTVAVEFSLVFFFVVAVLGIASALDRFISSRHT